MKQKIALFGGTGQTGSEFLRLALAEGYKVRLLARNPDKLKISHSNLEVLKGDVLNPTDVNNTVQGCNVVVSLFGHVKGSPDWLQTEGTQNIAEAMKRASVEKIISLSGGGLPYPEKDQPKFIDKFIRGVMRLLVPKILHDAVKHHQVLAKSSLKWVIVRAPRLTNGKQVGTYKVSWVGVNSGTQISRADLADFIVKQVESNTFLYQMPFVSYAN